MGAVDERYQSYNVEMLEVTGGRFWRPYSPEFEAILKQPAPAAKSSTGDTPAGMNPELYEYRAPLDLTNSRLRKLAAALGPTYVRVSGTWANTTYLPETDKAPSQSPARLRGRADSRAVERISRLCECRGWPYCDFFRQRRRDAQRTRCLDKQPGEAISRLHQVGRRQYCGGGVHE